MRKKIISMAFVAVASTALFAGCASTGDPQTSYTQAKQDFASKNYSKAFTEVQGPARAGDADAQYALGYMYFYGKGTSPDRAQAKYWFNLAAQQGQADAKRALELVK